jgi:hypothetical protein
MSNSSQGQRSKPALGWSCGHLDEAGFSPVLELAHFQASLKGVKIKKVGGRAGQAA